MTRRALVTGARGFVGRHLVRELQAHGYEIVGAAAMAGSRVDLREYGFVCSVYKAFEPDVVFHLAARCGGIGANQNRPAEFFYDNMAMGMNVLEAARTVGNNYWPKIVMVGTVCSYPKYTAAPFSEAALWDGYPEETNAAYGVAKRALITMAQAYRQQYAMDIVTLLPANLYGPGDNFDLETSHVIPAMIRKIAAAKKAGDKWVQLWGSGAPTRDFLYVGDCVEALIKADRKYFSGEPLNIGTGSETSMLKLARTIATQVGYEGLFSWDTSKPDGQMRRVLDIAGAWHELGWKAETSLGLGIAETVAWYLEHEDAIALGERP